MKLLLICTAHNSLSQRLWLTLSRDHEVTVEYALSSGTIIDAANIAKPDLIICPFLTMMIPKEVYTKWMTFIVHPGPPGDGGPSALDWLIMGDDGTTQNSQVILGEERWSDKGRSHWGVTVLQANQEFDAGPIWAFEQFPVDIDDHKITKSSLYRGAVTRAAVKACVAAIDRLLDADEVQPLGLVDGRCRHTAIGPHLLASEDYATRSVTTSKPFLGGQTRPLPLLKAAERDFDIKRHSAQTISRRIRSSDSQPGCLSNMWNPALYVYGGIIEDGEHMTKLSAKPGDIIATRADAVCVATVDGKGIWITHVRRIKRKFDPNLWPKVPALPLLMELGILDSTKAPQLLPPLPADFSKLNHPTFQDMFVEYQTLDTRQRVAYLTFDLYNGAMSTNQCYELCAALRSILATHMESSPLSAVVLLGGSYFSNGIHLNVIEAASDQAAESWMNINAINDVVLMILQDFASKNITTISALRGNAAAGGVALAAAADLVLAGEEVVLNPAYRALGLHGSEYHTITYAGRTGDKMARHLLRDMLPVSARHGKEIGLVDAIIPGHGAELDAQIRKHVAATLTSGSQVGLWKQKLDLSPVALARVRTRELGEMSKDFWSTRSHRYHTRRRDFVRKVKATKTPLRFARHRRHGEELDEEEMDSFDRFETFETLVNQVREKVLAESMVQLQAARRVSTPTTLLEKMNWGPVFSCYYQA